MDVLPLCFNYGYSFPCSSRVRADNLLGLGVFLRFWGRRLFLDKNMPIKHTLKKRFKGVKVFKKLFHHLGFCHVYTLFIDTSNDV